MIPQKYYKINLATMPEKLRALFVRQDNHTYHYKFDKILPHRCEICWQEEGSVTELKDGVETTYGAGHAKGFIHNELREVYSYDSVHAEYTLIFLLAQEAEPMTEEDVLNWVPQHGDAIIPGVIQDTKYNQKIAPLIKRAVQDYDGIDRSKHLRVYSALLEILALMTDYSLAHAQTCRQQSQVKVRRCRKACAYIAENLNQKLTVNSVANHIGVSYNYLPQLFGEVMGMPLVEYINRLRIQKAQLLITQYGTPLEQAAEMVGITDPKYFCRLFKKYTGITASEYKNRHK